MTRRGVLFALLIVTAGLALSACREVPVYNVQETPLALRSDNVTVDDVADAIVRAGVRLGWSMDEESPGHIVGTLDTRDHRAVVDIYFTTDSFSIAYKDSSNLLYTGSTIHRNYNRWVMNLEQAIQREAVEL